MDILTPTGFLLMHVAMLTIITLYAIGLEPIFSTTMVAFFTEHELKTV